jgi:hypothetical protein
LLLGWPCSRHDSGVHTSVCDPQTFSLGQQILRPLAGDLEINGCIQDHVHASGRSWGVLLGGDHAKADSRSHRRFDRSRRGGMVGRSPTRPPNDGRHSSPLSARQCSPRAGSLIAPSPRTAADRHRGLRRIVPVVRARLPAERASPPARECGGLRSPCWRAPVLVLLPRPSPLWAAYRCGCQPAARANRPLETRSPSRQTLEIPPCRVSAVSSVALASSTCNVAPNASLGRRCPHFPRSSSCSGPPPSLTLRLLALPPRLGLLSAVKTGSAHFADCRAGRLGSHRRNRLACAGDVLARRVEVEAGELSA